MDSVIQFEGTIYENGYGLLARKVMRDESLHKNARLIYAYMCSFAGIDKNGERTAFPSVSLQCKELDMSEDTYYKWRKQLVNRGLIKITKQRSEGGKFYKNIYSIVAVPVPVEKEETEKPDENTINQPYPKNSGVENQPYPKNSSTVKPSTVNSGTIINSFNNNSFNKNRIKEEEEEASLVKSNLVKFLTTKNISIDNAIKFENKLLKEQLTDYTNEQVLEAIEWSLEQFEQGKCHEPYIYAVGRLKRMLDGKLKEVAVKPKSNRKNDNKTKELVPDWFYKENQEEISDEIIDFEAEREKILKKLHG